MPAGPFGLLGATEGLSYLLVLGLAGAGAGFRAAKPAVFLRDGAVLLEVQSTFGGNTPNGFDLGLTVVPKDTVFQKVKLSL